MHTIDKNTKLLDDGRHLFPTTRMTWRHFPLTEYPQFFIGECPNPNPDPNPDPDPDRNPNPNLTPFLTLTQSSTIF